MNLPGEDPRGQVPAAAPESSRVRPSLRGEHDSSRSGVHPSGLRRVTGARMASWTWPATEQAGISGDFVDVYGAADDWLLVLGDVCGAGLEAARLASPARRGIGEAARADHEPTGVLAALNEVLNGIDTDRFVSAVCARLRIFGGGESALVDVAVAGHPAPLILRADGTVEEVDTAGVVAGVLADPVYGDVPVRIERDDTVLMFTDGVFEAGDATGRYGMDRLRRLLPPYAGAAPEAVIRAVERDVVEFLGGNRHDDIAVLAVTCGS